jgi:hypothetical protein
MWNTGKNEYLGEFETKIENILELLWGGGGQEGTFDETTVN